MSAAANSGWRDFWKCDCLASCEPDNPETAREIAALWVSWLEGIPDGSRILDVATGNGVLLAHAAAAARSRSRAYSLTGIDLADIDPPRYVSHLPDDLRRARFLGGIAAENLPFEPRSFDAAVSQYGLEYADLDRALPEIARILPPGGALIWLAHSEDSEIVRQHRRQAEEFEYVLAPDGPLDGIKRYVSALNGPEDAAESGNRLRDCFIRAEAWCRANPPGTVIRELCHGFAAAVQNRRTPDPGDLAEKIRVAEQRLLAHRDRIRSLLAAVMTTERMEIVRARLTGPIWQDLSTAEVRVGQWQAPIGLRIGARLASTEPRP